MRSLRCTRRARAPTCLRGLANNQGLANALAEYQTRYGDWRELFSQLDRVDKVTKADIRRVANQVFVASNRTTAQIDTAGSRGLRKEGWERTMKNLSISRLFLAVPVSCLVGFSVRRCRAAKQALGKNSRFLRCTNSNRNSQNASL